MDDIQQKRVLTLQQVTKTFILGLLKQIQLQTNIQIITKYPSRKSHAIEETYSEKLFVVLLLSSG